MFDTEKRAVRSFVFERTALLFAICKKLEHISFAVFCSDGKKGRLSLQQLNVRTKKYMGRNDRFADLCNYYLFHGEPVIQPESLVEKDVTELGTVLEFCQSSNDKKKIKQLIQNKKKDGICLERESFEVLNECLNVKMELSEQEGELREMCKAMEDWAAEDEGVRKEYYTLYNI